MKDSSSIRVIKLDGALEIGRREEIVAAFVLDDSGRSVLVDLSDVSYADSSALSTLLRFRAEATRRKLQIALLIGSRQFARLIQYAGLEEAFKTFTDRGEALAFLSGVVTP